jgi:hypothetical protein
MSMPWTHSAARPECHLPKPGAAGGAEGMSTRDQPSDTSTHLVFRRDILEICRRRRDIVRPSHGSDQTAEAARLDAAIRANLEGLGHGG